MNKETTNILASKKAKERLVSFLTKTGQIKEPSMWEKFWNRLNSKLY
jgi:hypothetical protein